MPCFELMYLSFIFFFFSFIRQEDSYLKAVLVTVLLLPQLFSSRNGGAWLVLFWDKENGPCEPRYSVLSDDLCSVLKLLHQHRFFWFVFFFFFCCLLSKQVHQSSYSHLQFSVVEALCAERREVSFSQYLFAFGLEEEAERFSIWDQRQAHAMGRNIVFSIVLRIVVPEFPHSVLSTLQGLQGKKDG